MQKVGEDSFATTAALKIFSIDHPKVVTEEVKSENFCGASFKIPAGLRRSESIKIEDGEINKSIEKINMKISSLQTSMLSSDSDCRHAFLIYPRDEFRNVFREILVPLVQDLTDKCHLSQANNECTPQEPVIASKRQEFKECCPEDEDAHKSDNYLYTSGKFQGFVKYHAAAADDRTSRLCMNVSSMNLRQEQRYLLRYFCSSQN